jgi:hypothetical protein
MEIDLNSSTLAHSSSKGSPYCPNEVNVLRGYIHPSDYLVAAI